MTTSDPEADDRDFLDAFEAAAISRERWTHRAHLRVAYLMLRDRGADDGLVALQQGIPRLNQALGVEEGPESGYHETVTVAWARIVAAAIADDQAEGDAADQRSSAFLARHPELFDPRLLLRYYSRERIMSVHAKREFVPPDVAPLP